MNLFEMVPKESKLKLKCLKKVITLRPINLSDEAWLVETYGANNLTTIFEDMNIPEIARIVFRLISDEDKTLFKLQEVTIINEAGESIEETLGGVDLFRTMISGWEDKLAVFNALLENIGASRPEVNETKPVKKKKVTKKKVSKKIKVRKKKK